MTPTLTTLACGVLNCADPATKVALTYAAAAAWRVDWRSEPHSRRSAPRDQQSLT